MVRRLLILTLLFHAPAKLRAETAASASAAASSQTSATFSAEDSLAIPDDADPNAQACLDGLKWQPQEFRVTYEETGLKGYDRLVRFPSAMPSGKAANDSVTMEWYLARDEEDQPITAPAMIVVHESGGGMHVGRLFARGFQAGEIHAFMIHLPYYGERRTSDDQKEGEKFIAALRQAAADVRRARDAVAALPLVDNSHIGVQGTSLGGFVTTTAASLDDRFDSVFILLAGAELHDVIVNGQMDARAVRRSLARAGYSGQKLKDELYKVEPSRIAHRLNAQRTWLYSATKDRVVPLKNGNALAKVAGISDDHHIKINANHYSGIVYFPILIKGMARRVNESVN